MGSGFRVQGPLGLESGVQGLGFTLNPKPDVA